jgi:hypothetical protein
MGLVGSGVIGPGGAEYFDVVLHGAHTYQVMVQPMEIGVDFDLHVYDENGNLVNEDISPAANAYCAITPRWTGPFRLVVNSTRGISSYQIQVLD